jgi:succinate dehydrogenase / fumarate reductase cytochrome b subunit
MARGDRPLSPHLGVYRWQISNSLSILHRLTGVMLSLGTLVLVSWLVSVAAGYGPYSVMNAFLDGPLGSLMLFGWTFCFFYHLANGIRHLAWDIGYGFESRQARLSGVTVVVISLVLTLGVWVSALADVGG